MLEINGRNFDLYVVAIPSEYSVLISGGKYLNDTLASKGNSSRIVSLNQKLTVISPGEPVIDPVSGGSLGYYDIKKETLEVIRIHSHFFECGKINKEANLSKVLSPMFVGNNTYEKLDVNYAQMLLSSEDIDKTINIKDPVVRN